MSQKIIIFWSEGGNTRYYELTSPYPGPANESLLYEHAKICESIKKVAGVFHTFPSITGLWITKGPGEDWEEIHESIVKAMEWNDVNFVFVRNDDDD